MHPPVPDTFVATMRNVHGQRGVDWCAQLPVHLRTLAGQWDLALGPAYPLSYNYVCSAIIRHSGTAVVLKTAPHNPEFATEVAMLQHYNGRAAVDIRAVDHANSAFLMTAADPGTRLVDGHLSDEAQTHAAALLMQSSWSAYRGDVPLPTIRGQTAVLATLARTHPAAVERIGLTHVEAAIARCQLLHRPADDVALHGDLHHENILRHGAGWEIIDPKGVIGNPAAECAAFLRNPARLLDSGVDIVALTIRRIDILSSVLAIPAATIAGWNYALMVLSAWWCYEEEQTVPVRVLSSVNAFARVAAHYEAHHQKK